MDRYEKISEKIDRTIIKARAKQKPPHEILDKVLVTMAIGFAKLNEIEKIRPRVNRDA